MKIPSPLVLLTATIGFCSQLAAQNTPVGKWHNVDEKTNEVKTEVIITESDHVLTGKISKLLRKDARQDAVCDKCTDDRKGAPIVGLEIIRGAKKDPNENVWPGGKVLDPEKGKEYKLTLTPVEGGKKLEVRGSIGPFGRTQTWVRVQ